MAPTKPKVHIDQDGDGDTDVSVDVDTGPGSWPEGVREQINLLVGRMEVVLPPGTQRVSYTVVRETLRGILTAHP